MMIKKERKLLAKRSQLKTWMTLMMSQRKERKSQKRKRNQERI